MEAAGCCASSTDFQQNNLSSFSLSPIGLDALYENCRKLYPNQLNPLQVTAKTKYWLGGPDPLDYISMYDNPGDTENGIPSHWHYVSFGLSDLHGDGRVHEFSGPDTTSGFGFELTFRLKKGSTDDMPPTWPAPVMQSLAKYVFNSDNVLCAGDHVSWHQPLDYSESRLQHILVMSDPQLETVNTPFGSVNFVQIIGVCTEELQAAQHWNGPGVIELMKTIPGAGGPWLITDMRRGETIFEIDPSIQEAVDQGIDNEGSNLTCVSARCSWADIDILNMNKDCRTFNSNCPTDYELADRRVSAEQCEEIKSALKKGLLNSKPVLPPIGSDRVEVSSEQSEESTSRKESYDSNTSESTLIETIELLPTRSFDGVHLQFNLEAGSLLPLALKGRLRHGRHFTFKSVLGDVAITLVTPTVSGSIVSTEYPYASRGPWLQVLLDEEFSERMIQELESLSDPDELTLPINYSWPDKKLSITINHDF